MLGVKCQVVGEGQEEGAGVARAGEGNVREVYRHSAAAGQSPSRTESAGM